MGYAIHQRDSRFAIRDGHHAEAFETLREHFPEELERAEDLRDALLAFGWETDESCAWLWYLGDRYSEIYERLFAVIAPFVTGGSWIEMQGQEGEIWRWEFEGGRLYEQEAVIAWTGRRVHIPAPQHPMTGEQAGIFGF